MFCLMSNQEIPIDAPSTSGRDGSTTPNTVWLRYRTSRGTLLGRLANDDEEDWGVETDDGVLQIPRRQGRIVDEGSMEFIDLAQPGQLAADFQVDPIGLVVRLLSEEGSRDAKGIYERLRAYGVPLEAAEWKKLQPKLRKNIHIVFANGNYGWNDDPPPLSIDEIDGFLVGILSGRTKGEAREQAATSLSGVAGHLDPTRTVLAREGGVDLPPTDWQEVSLDGLGENLGDRLLSIAAREGAWSFLVGVALDASRAARAAESVKLIASRADAGPAVVAGINNVRLELLTLRDRASRVKTLATRLPFILRIAEGSSNDNVIQPLIGLIDGIAIDLDATSEASGLDLVGELARCCVHVAKSEEVLARELSDSSASHRVIAMVGAALEPLPFTDPTRTTWLRVVASSLHKGVLAGRTWWSNMTLQDLEAARRDLVLGPVLSDNPSVALPVIREALSKSPPSIGAILDLPSDLLTGDVSRLILRASDRLEPGHPLRVVIDADTVRVVTAESTRLTQEFEAQISERESAAVERETVIKDLEAKVADAESHVELLSSRLRELRVAKSDNDAGHRRHERMDVLIVVAGILAQIERSIPGILDGGFTIQELLDAIARLGATVGVSRDAASGELVLLDRAKYEFIGDDSRTEGWVKVVEPAFVSHEGDETLIIRRGKVADSNSTK